MYAIQYVKSSQIGMRKNSIFGHFSGSDFILDLDDLLQYFLAKA